MNERGLTLVELLVAVTLSVTIFGLVASSLVAYQNNAQRSTRQNQSQSQARVAIDRIVRELRDVASSRTSPTLIESAGPYDLVFQMVASGTPAAGNPTGLARVRYCIPPDPSPGSAGTEVLIAQTQTWTTAAAPSNPWATSTACPSTPAAVAGSSVSTTRLAEDVMNRFAGAARPAFTYNSGVLSEIATVGVELFVDVSASSPPDETVLRSAAFLRNQNQAPVVSFTDTATGGGHILLNGGGSSDPDNQQLTYEWFRVVGGVPTLIGSSGLLDWAPGAAGTYSVRLEVTDPGGLTSTETRTVVVT